MKRISILVSALRIAAASAAIVVSMNVALAQAPAAATAPASTAKYSSSTTQLGVLLADPAAKAVLQKHIPQLVANSDVAERASGMTLHEIQEATKAYAPDMLSDKVLAEIDVDLAPLPVKP